MRRAMLVWAVVLFLIVGFVAYRNYDGAQRVVGLDQLVAQASASAEEKRVAPEFQYLVTGPEPADGMFWHGVQNFLAHPLTSGDLDEARPESTRFIAPVAIVDLDRKRFDAAQARLPANVRAPNVKTARTLVFVRCYTTKEDVHYVTHRGPTFDPAAYSRHCNTVAFDMKAQGEPVLLAVRGFGEGPPDSINRLDPRNWLGVIAAEPVGQISNFVEDTLES